MTGLRILLEDLRRGERPGLSLDETEQLLAWLTGSATRGAQPEDALPRPGHDPVLLQMVFYRLDAELFVAGELKLAAAGLDVIEPSTRRRIRFRRLASAFHPDRFPELADWLTERSQAVHRAYSRFKANPEAPGATRLETPLHAQPHASSPPRQDMRRDPPRMRKHRIRALANRLRARIGYDRYLAHKLIGAVAVIALLPVLNMVLVPGKDTVSGFRVPVSGEQRVGRGGIPEDTAVGGASSPDSGRPSAQDAPPTASQAGNQPTSRPATGVGAGPAGDERGPESRIASNEAEAAEPDAPARKPETGNPKPSPSATDPEIPPLLAAARRAMNPSGHLTSVATLPSVDEQLAAMSLPDDTERLYGRMGEDDEETVSGFRVPVSGESEAGTDSVPSIRVGAGLVGDDQGPGSRIASAPAEAAEPDAPARKPETGTPKPSPSAQDAPPTASKLGNQPTSRPATGVGAGPAGDERGPESRIASNEAEAAEPDAPARKPPPSELVLGPLATHPAGKVLERLHEALVAGNIPGIADSFAADASMNALRGRNEIADHFRAALIPADSRQVQLKVIRLRRRDDGWRIEADLDIRIDRGDDSAHLMQGRNNFWLTHHADRLSITRMEHE